MTNFKPTVTVAGEGKPATNALVFATIEEAQASARDLYSRWTLCIDYGTMETTDPVNYRLDLETYELTAVKEVVA